MNKMDKAIVDISKIISICNKYGDDAATPMPFSTVKEAYEALIFKKLLLDSVSGLETTPERAKKRVDAFQTKMSTAVTNNVDRESLTVATAILQFILDEYFSV